MSAIVVRAWLAALVCCAWIACHGATAVATDASEGRQAVQDGNRLYREGRYAAAVSRYLASGQADRSAVVQYNLGVCHYRLGQYEQAERWFRAAAQHSKFAARARYNLGLVYWARGEKRSAHSAFEAAEQLAGDGPLRSLAARALDELHRGADAPALRPKLPAGVRAGFSLLTSTRAGSDDNVYRTPDTPYVDLSRTGQPLVTPVKESGSFVEVGVVAQNLRWTGRHTLLRAAYEFDGLYYTDGQLENANESYHRLVVTTRQSRGQRLDQTLLTRLQVGYRNEGNFDPDNGVDRVVAGEDISDRFHYRNALFRTGYERPVGSVTAGVHVLAELRDYGHVEAVPEYDNAFYLAGVTASLPLLDRVRLGLGYDWYVRTYDERQAQSADGTIGATNPTLEYRYNRMTLAVMLDLESTQLNIAYDLTDRADQFVGYSDYRRHAFRINGSWRPMRRLTLEFLGTAESYAYENAYAFDVPQGGRKTLDYVGGELHARFSLTRHLQLWAGARYWNSDSSDPRIAYTRAQFPVGLAWAQRF